MNIEINFPGGNTIVDPVADDTFPVRQDPRDTPYP